MRGGGKMIKRIIKGLGCGLFLLAVLTLLSSPLEAQNNRGGGVPVEALSVSLKTLDIKDHFIASSSPKAGVIRALKGHVVIIHRGTEEAFFGQEGDIVYENDAINTLENSRCQIKFYNEDVVKLASDTEFGVETYLDKRNEGRKTTIFSILKGKAKFYALRLLRYRKSKFEVKTPTAVVGVRGTKFGVHVYWEGEPKLGKGGLQVADSSKGIGNYLTQLESGGTQKSYTDSHVDEGEIQQNGVSIPAGFGYSGKTGILGPMDPAQRDAFDSETSALEGGKEIKQEQKKEQTTQEVMEEQASEKGSLAEQIALQTETTFEQTAPQPSPPASTPEPPPIPAPTPPSGGNKMGYFAAMMNRSSLDTSLHDVYATSTRQDFNSASIKGGSILDSGGYIESNPDGFINPGDPSLTRIVTDGGATDSGASANGDITIPGEWTTTYMTWGRWTMNDPVSIGAHDYTIDDIARYIYGQTTPNEAVAGFSGTAQYTGDAYGAYVGNIFMDGNFSSDVNFNNSQVSNFNLNVSDGTGDHTANITGAFGSLNGSEFNLSGGTWNLFKEGGTKTPSHQSLQGSLYGPNGEEMGGVWGMYYNDGHAATGVFVGDKQ